ncbi:MAG: FAD-binding oxidoreductase [Thalassobaculaceae bacterium]|nr:FAD-binding oxidoreductase [Thalassobaculaceae bacterium]
MGSGFDDHGAVPAIYDRWGRERALAPAGKPAGHADVAIIGGGITGLSAACHLVPRGASVAVLEAREIGWGASGRAFGQIVPTLKHSNQRIIDLFGPERGERLIAAIGDGPDVVLGLIEKHSIDCGAVRTGLLFAAHSSSGLRGLEGYADDWRNRGAAVDVLDRSATAHVVGSDYYRGACIDRRGGHLNPLAYTRGLARAAVEGGVRVYVDTRVTRVARQGTVWQLALDGGELTADRVILATNAYTGSLWSDVARSLVPMRVHAAATEPMPQELMAGILPQAHPLTDTRRLYSGVRRIPEGRLHLTVDGPPFGRHTAPYLHTAERRLAALFADAPRPVWEESWNGWIAVTREQMPRLHALAPGLFAGFGYSGRGLAAATLMGRDLARLAGGADERDITFPLSAVTPIRGRSLAPLGIATLIQGWRMLDRLDERPPSAVG